MVVHCTGAGRLLEEEVGEIREVAGGVEGEARERRAAALNGVRGIIAIEVDRVGLSEEGWEMVDTLEAFIARKWEGIVYAEGEGFYDAELKLIAKVE